MSLCHSRTSPDVLAETKYRARRGCYQAKDYHEAVQNLREAVRLDPTKIAYHKLLGQALTKSPLWRKQAETHLRRVLDAEPYDKDCYLELATIYEEGGLSTRARQMYERVASLDPDHKVALKKLGFEGEAERPRFFASSSEKRTTRRTNREPSSNRVFGYTTSVKLPRPILFAVAGAMLLSSPTLAQEQKRLESERDRGPEATFQRLDDDGDGKLSPDELNMLARARFDQLDRDDDGVLSFDEFREMESQRDPEATFRRLDADDDGRIARDELPEWLRARFESVDTNDDGFVDEGEMKMMALRAREARNAPSGLMRRLMELDLDGDGRLHRDELSEAMEYLRAQFERFDFNADDYLDGAELRAMTEQTRRRGRRP